MTMIERWIERKNKKKMYQPNVQIQILLFEVRISIVNTRTHSTQCLALKQIACLLFIITSCIYVFV